MVQTNPVFIRSIAENALGDTKPDRKDARMFSQNRVPNLAYFLPELYPMIVRYLDGLSLMRLSHCVPYLRIFGDTCRRLGILLDTRIQDMWPTLKLNASTNKNNTDPVRKRVEIKCLLMRYLKFLKTHHAKVCLGGYSNVCIKFIVPSLIQHRLAGDSLWEIESIGSRGQRFLSCDDMFETVLQLRPRIQEFEMIPHWSPAKAQRAFQIIQSGVCIRELHVYLEFSSYLWRSGPFSLEEVLPRAKGVEALCFYFHHLPEWMPTCAQLLGLIGLLKGTAVRVVQWGGVKADVGACSSEVVGEGLRCAGWKLRVSESEEGTFRVCHWVKVRESSE
ncbi:hypothetical protein HDU81_011427 [Chytriomyces hyalinus]|nr:hypothetical protein HDU81_011427 [Chytriomyces hyalinus]